jgi:hypothetical protein
MAFSRTCTLIYIGLVALLDSGQSSFSSITISTYSQVEKIYLKIYDMYLYLSIR